MISRVRPFFHKSYIDSLNRFELDTGRERYHQEISRKLKNYYPDAKAFEFFNYGRSSLSTGFIILDFKENDEILVPCFTCETVLEPIISHKIKPILYDIELDFSVSIDQLKKKITKKTKAIIITHFFGIPSNLKEIKDFASSQDVYLIEDSAQSFGSKINDIVLGSIGDFSFTSFGNDKPLSIATGSCLIINNKELLEKFREVIPKIQLNEIYNEKCSFLSLLFFYLNTERSIYNRFVGIYDFYDYFLDQNSDVDLIFQKLHNKDLNLVKLYREIQYKNRLLSSSNKVINYITHKLPKSKIVIPNRMNCFSLNILDTAVDFIEEVNIFRKKIGCVYTDHFLNNNKIIAPVLQKNIPFLRYPIICKKPEMTSFIVKRLNMKGYECGNFNWPQPLNKILKISETFENSEFISQNIINLPCHIGMNENDVNEIADVINKGIS